MKKFLIIAYTIVNTMGLGIIDSATARNPYIDSLSRKTDPTEVINEFFAASQHSEASLKFNLKTKLESLKMSGVSEDQIKNEWFYEFANADNFINADKKITYLKEFSPSLQNLSCLISYSLTSVFPDNPGATDYGLDSYGVYNRFNGKIGDESGVKKGRQHFINQLVSTCATLLEKSNPTGLDKVILMGLMVGWLCYETLCNAMYDEYLCFDEKNDLENLYSASVESVIASLEEYCENNNQDNILRFLQRCLNESMTDYVKKGKSTITLTGKFESDFSAFMRHDWDCYLVQTGVISSIKCENPYGGKIIPYPEYRAFDQQKQIGRNRSVLEKCREIEEYKNEQGTGEFDSVWEIVGHKDLQQDDVNMYFDSYGGEPFVENEKILNQPNENNVVETKLENNDNNYAERNNENKNIATQNRDEKAQSNNLDEKKSNTNLFGVTLRKVTNNEKNINNKKIKDNEAGNNEVIEIKNMLKRIENEKNMGNNNRDKKGTESANNQNEKGGKNPVFPKLTKVNKTSEENREKLNRKKDMLAETISKLKKVNEISIGAKAVNPVDFFNDMLKVVQMENVCRICVTKRRLNLSDLNTQKLDNQNLDLNSVTDNIWQKDKSCTAKIASLISVAVDDDCSTYYSSRMPNKEPNKEEIEICKKCRLLIYELIYKLISTNGNINVQNILKQLSNGNLDKELLQQIKNLIGDKQITKLEFDDDTIKGLIGKDIFTEARFSDSIGYLNFIECISEEQLKFVKDSMTTAALSSKNYGASGLPKPVVDKINTEAEKKRVNKLNLEFDKYKSQCARSVLGDFIINYLAVLKGQKMDGIVWNTTRTYNNSKK